MKQYEKYIIQGIKEPLSQVPFHRDTTPVERLLMLDKHLLAVSDIRVAVHIVNCENTLELPDYTDLHKHSNDEIVLILSEDDKLVYDIQMENEIFRVESPVTVYIPKETHHSAKVVEGKGTFICIILSGTYSASK